MDDLVDEATKLRDGGVKEIQMIAQDLSYYGLDLYKSQKLPQLVERIAQIEGIEWIRLHYAYPAGFPIDLLKVMNDQPKVCNYLDIALQHASDHMLKQMRRNVTKAQTIDLIGEMRRQVPGIHLRTTLITGHPGETDQDFGELLEFVETMRFERLGVFPYSHEDDTHAFKNYADDVPDDLKQSRAEEVMALQNGISAQLNNSKIGQKMKVIIDRKENDSYIGRTEFDSPEVDQEVIIDAANGELAIGDFYQVTITGSEDYDLYGEVIR